MSSKTTKNLLKLTILICFFLFFNSQSTASILDWRTYETKSFTVYFPKGFEHQAQETLFYLQQNKSYIQKITGNKNHYKSIIVIQDMGLETNGFSDFINDRVTFYANSPSSTSQLARLENWPRMLGVHELTHQNHQRNVSGIPQLYTTIFGSMYSPNIYSPLWVLEGITVYTESQISPYEGRLNDGYYEAIVACKAKAGKLPNPSQANYFHFNYPLGQHYVYGGAFFDYLAKEHSEETFAEFFSESGSNRSSYMSTLIPQFGLDRSAKKIYKKTLFDLYKDWQVYETKKHSNWQIKGVLISKPQYVSNDYALSSYQGLLYYVRKKIQQNHAFIYNFHSQIIEYNPKTGTEKIIEKENTPMIGECQRIRDNLYFAVTDVINGFDNTLNFGYGSIAFLNKLDLKTNIKEPIFSAEFKDFVVINENKIIYVVDKKGRFGSEVWEYHSGTKTKLGITKRQISELEIINDHIYVVAKKQLGSWDICELDLTTLKTTPIIDSAWAETNLKAANEKLYFTANYDKKVGVYCYNLKNRKTYSLTDSSYASNGFVIDNNLYYVGININAEQIYKAKTIEKEYTQKDHEKTTKQEFVFDPKLKPNNALSADLGSMALPSIRFLPYLAYGQDALSYNSYLLNYNSYAGVDIEFNTKLLMPLSLNFSNVQLSDERKTYISASYPIYKSNRKGLSNLYLGYSTDLESKVPAIQANWNYPEHTISAQASSDLNNNGYSLGFSEKVKLDNAQILLRANGFKNIDSIAAIRGYTKTKYDETSGYSYSLEMSRQFMQIRNGWWNPNFFAGDIYISAFYDYFEARDYHDNIGSYGFELSMETGMGFWGYLITKVGVAFGEIDTIYYFGLGF